MRYPRTLCSIQVNNPGSGSGSGTVQTDGVTIQGNGSGGSPIAIKQVETDATITGAGTVASPLSAAQQTPTGWPLLFYSVTVQGQSATTVKFANNANTLNIWGIFLPAQVRFGHFRVFVQAADAVNNSDLGLYNSAGTLVAHIGAQTIAGTGEQGFAVSGGTVTVNAGVVYWATTSVGTTAALFASGSTLNWTLQQSTNFSSSSGGALPSTITPPATAVQNLNFPAFALYP